MHYEIISCLSKSHCICLGAVAFSNAFYGMATGPIHISNVRCTGNEGGLINCTYDRLTSASCNHNNDAGVLCQGTCTCTT